MNLTIAAFTVALLAAFFVPLALALRRSLAPCTRLRLPRMLERAGIDTGTLGTPGVCEAVERAAGVCARCPNMPECDAWLASRRRDGFDAFCPNAPVVRRIGIAGRI